ncbi:hypothetical protein FA15DRAFT_668897 [Coprinopsis marcescibilis]|uniref:Mini-chromosome maintenance complex-binding protein n=1 Tax=Coprinopsis marcescibilis TaxID=230819 RepID=A0A5C3KYW4_COPMA|nr:hypothetical protein FA15DRAFT_668897 [Coprinopsis marcescibilis]
MVSSLLVDALTDPTESLLQFYRSTHNRELLGESVSKYFNDIFLSQNAFEEIPVLDIHHPPECLKSRALVRFDSMVQDTSCPSEIYLAQRANGDCGGWGLNDVDEHASQDDILDYSLLQECGVVWATSIPGQSEWLLRAPAQALSTAPTSAQPHKYPIPGAPHVGAQIKIYDSHILESLRATDLYSFIGILTSEPLHSPIESQEVALVPTIHLLFARPIPPTVVPRIFPDHSLVGVEDVRDKLVSWMATEALAGDRAAAELVLLTIIHKVQSRTPPLLPLSLTLSGYGQCSGSTPKIAEVLRHLVPLCTVLPLSLDNLNATSYNPESKEENLHSGWLQLPKGSLCIVSETAMNEGSVTEKGLLNLRQIQDMINMQTLDYVFPFSRYTFETDVTFLVIAGGNRSAFFKTHLEVPVRDAEGKAPAATELASSETAIQLPPPELLNQFRQLIGGAKISSVGLDGSTAEFIQDDFVKERQAAQSHKNVGKAEGMVTSDDLIIRMMVAKTMAASLHRTEVSAEIWERAKWLENLRQTRVST